MKNIRNIAIIAHVDHGKTTLVDFLLKQSHTFRENSEEQQKDLIMDSNELERERGITILAKNTAITYVPEGMGADEGIKINIIDTPGHADFGGEVERTLHMADGCLLLVDAQEGPMPQTRFVLQKALALGLKPIVVINKIDKRDRRVAEVLDEIHELFLELATHHDQLDFPVVYAIGRKGIAFDAMPQGDPNEATGSLKPLFEKIITEIPEPTDDPEGPFQLIVTALDYDDYKGRYAIGRIRRGRVRKGMGVAVIGRDGVKSSARIEAVYVSRGLERVETPEAEAGDIVALTGLAAARINTTLCDPATPQALPSIAIEEPTLRMLVGPNTSPFTGREGKFVTSRQLEERFTKELETNVSLRMDRLDGGKFLLSGRGELHLSVLIETMRREGFEMEVGRPEVIVKEVDGKMMEPREEAVIDVPEEYRGVVTAELARRRAELKNTFPHASGARFIYEIPTKALLGLRSTLLTKTRGSFTLHSRFLAFAPQVPALDSARNGVLIAHETGKALSFGLNIAQGRGVTFIGPGTEVYEGMIIGENGREEDIAINVCKGKELTNMRASGSDENIMLTPPRVLTLEDALEYIADDELVEVTPKFIRLRKKYLTKVDRDRNKH
ncbi:MAG: translational GTPase TypA [bacterium]|nr:translational GTPase TypA [bacterium]